MSQCVLERICCLVLRVLELPRADGASAAMPSELSFESKLMLHLVALLEELLKCLRAFECAFAPYVSSIVRALLMLYTGDATLAVACWSPVGVGGLQQRRPLQAASHWRPALSRLLEVSVGSLVVVVWRRLVGFPVESDATKKEEEREAVAWRARHERPCRSLSLPSRPGRERSPPPTGRSSPPLRPLPATAVDAARGALRGARGARGARHVRVRRVVRRAVRRPRRARPRRAARGGVAHGALLRADPHDGRRARAARAVAAVLRRVVACRLALVSPSARGSVGGHSSSRRGPMGGPMGHSPSPEQSEHNNTPYWHMCTSSLLAGTIASRLVAAHTRCGHSRSW